MKCEVVGKKIGVIIAIENYCAANKPKIMKVDYALNDAHAIKETFIKQLDIEENNIHFWIEEDANRNTIINELSYLILQLDTKDELYFYYAGHGFYSGASNKLSCWDTHLSNLETTTICVRENLLDPLRQSKCKKSFIFIDACAENILSKNNARTLVSSFNEKEFKDFISNSTGHSCFFSCKPGQKSYPSTNDKHGLWTLHLLKALNGEAEEAIDNHNIITNLSLAEYLADRVPKYLTKNTTFRTPQTPYHLIENTTRSQLIEFIEDKEEINELEVKINFNAFRLLKEESIPFKDFEGFDKKSGHTVPTKHTISANSWAERLATKEVIKDEIEEIFSNARRPLRLRNSNCDKNADRGTLHTEYFRYDITATQSNEDYTKVKIKRELELRIPIDKFPCNIDEIFTNGFDSITFPISGKIDINQIEDSLYDLEDDDRGHFEHFGDVFKFIPNELPGVSSISIDTLNNSLQIHFTSDSTPVSNTIDYTKKSLAQLSEPIRALIEP